MLSTSGSKSCPLPPPPSHIPPPPPSHIASAVSSSSSSVSTMEMRHCSSKHGGPSSYIRCRASTLRGDTDTPSGHPTRTADAFFSSFASPRLAKPRHRAYSLRPQLSSRAPKCSPPRAGTAPLHLRLPRDLQRTISFRFCFRGFAPRVRQKILSILVFEQIPCSTSSNQAPNYIGKLG
jgi:hypothetical protein